MHQGSVNLSLDFAGISCASPVTVGSGTFGSGQEYAPFCDLTRLAAVVTKGVSVVPWPGNEGARIAETASGMLNSVGLQNAGVEHFIANDLVWLRENAPQANIIVNVVGETPEAYAAVVERLEEIPSIAGYEINISCPNVDGGGLAFGTNCAAASQVITEVRSKTKRPVIAKLTPNVTDIVSIAQSVEAAGADGISLINTLLGMAIDAEKFRPRFKRVVGGLSGPAIKPVALRMVWQVHKSVQVPIIGMGGVANATDAVEFMLAGATLVAVGTSTFKNPLTVSECIDGIEEFCVRHGVREVSELIGALHE